MGAAAPSLQSIHPKGLTPMAMQRSWQRPGQRLWRHGGLILAIAIACWGCVVPGAWAAAGLSTGGLGPAPVPVVASIFGSLFAGQRPTNLGIKDGQLAPCPPSPNCVSTTANPTDLSHAIAPWSYGDSSAEQAWETVQDLVASAEGATLVQATDDYLYAEFTTSLMGFVDDVEFHLDRAANEIQVRSASRLGESDLGLNRQRLDRLRGQFERLQRTPLIP